MISMNTISSTNIKYMKTCDVQEITKCNMEIAFKGKIYYGTNVLIRLNNMDKNIPLKYIDNDIWKVYISNTNSITGHFVIEKNGIECHLLKEHILENNKINIFEYPCISQYSLEINRSRSLIDPHYHSVSYTHLTLPTKRIV